MTFNDRSRYIVFVDWEFETSAFRIRKNSFTEYYIEQDSQRWKLETVQEEKDLGIITTNDLNLKFSKQCNEAARKAMNVLRLIKRHFFKLDIPTFRILYKSFVRSHLEYSIQAWSPYLRKDIDVLEKIQRRATKLVIGLKNVPYYLTKNDYGALA